MRGKHRKSGSKPYDNRPVARRNDRFSKNNNFIQRSKRMEELHRRGNVFQSNAVESNELDKAVSLLPTLEDGTDDVGFYEQLVSEYNHIKTAPTFKTAESKTAECSAFELEHDDIEEETKPDNTVSESESYKSFTSRFNIELSADNIEDLISKEPTLSKSNWNAIGNFRIETPVLDPNTCSVPDLDYKQPPNISNPSDLKRLEVKLSLCTNTSYPLSPLQSELFHIVNNYQDLYYPHRSHHNAEEIRYMYCLHALNHMLKSRTLILRNNEKVAALAKSSKMPPSEISIPESYRDQGLKRMKILMIVPFRESAMKIVNIISKLLFGNQTEQNKKNGTIAKYERFAEDYSGTTIYLPKTNPKPLDYEQTFSGNTDDNFKMGIRFTKKSISLFSDLNTSDILIASPLALRMLINDKEQDYDFLNSIEMLIIDQAELFLAQNWENLLFTLDHLHLQPKKFPDTNCQRVRTWCLSGSSRFYRQTLFFASHELPEFRAVLSSKCHNFQGKIRVSNAVEHGDIRNVVTPAQQVFRRINCISPESVFEDRFEYFVKDVLPQFTGPSHSHCMLYVPSYFDYVRLRNHFKKEMISFVQISEYTKKEKISRARDIFFHSGAPFMLYSERAHFFRRTRIKGIRHLIMYQPPNWPNFYSELINLMLESNQNPRDGLRDAMSVTILYTKYDLLSLSNIVGSENAVKLTKGNKNSYLFSTKV